MARNGVNKLNKGYVGVNKFDSLTEGIKNPRNDYLNKVQNTVDISGLSADFTLDFTRPTTEWSPYLTFTRGTTASFLGSSGYITYADVNVPRITYDYLGNTLGLVIESPMRHVTTFSEEMNNAAYIKSNLALVGGTVDVGLAPDGTTTAELIVPNTSAVTHTISRLAGIGGSPGVPVNLSAFYKKAGNTYQAVRVLHRFSTLSPVQDDVACTLDLNNGTLHNILITKSGLTATDHLMVPYIVVEKYPNDWWRMSVIARTFSSNRSIFVYPLKTTTSSVAEAGTGVDGIYTWGWQMTWATSPIQYKRVDGSALTTSADDCVIAGSSFSSWFKTNGSFYVEYYNKEDYINQSLGIISNNQAPGMATPTIFSTQYSYQKIMNLCNLGVNGNKDLAFQTSMDSLVSTKGFTTYQALNKAAFSFTGTGSTYTIDFCLNGSIPQSMITNDLRPEQIKMMTIGSSGLTTSGQFFAHYNGIVRKIQFFSSPLTKDQLRALTNV